MAWQQWFESSWWCSCSFSSYHNIFGTCHSSNCLSWGLNHIKYAMIYLDGLVQKRKTRCTGVNPCKELFRATGPYQDFGVFWFMGFNSLWPGNAIWRHGSRSSVFKFKASFTVRGWQLSRRTDKLFEDCSYHKSLSWSLNPCRTGDFFSLSLNTGQHWLKIWFDDVRQQALMVRQQAITWTNVE